MHTKKNNEVWLGNHDLSKSLDHLKGLKTLRLGEQAYDYDGHKLSPEYYRPLFVAQEEEGEYDRIMIERIRRIRGFINS